MTTLNTIIEEEKKDYAVIKHIAEIADKHCPDLGVEHQATPAIDIINRFVTTAMQRAYEAGKEERDTYWKERVRKIKEKVERVRLDVDVIKCDCGEPYKDSDLDLSVGELEQALDTLLDNLKWEYAMVSTL